MSLWPTKEEEDRKRQGIKKRPAGKRSIPMTRKAHGQFSILRVQCDCDSWEAFSNKLWHHKKAIIELLAGKQHNNYEQSIFGNQTKI